MTITANQQSEVEYVKHFKLTTAGQKIVIQIVNADGTYVVNETYTLPTGKTFTGTILLHGNES